MTNSTYLRRLVGRIGIPSVEATLPLPPPDVPAPALFDPFAEAEPVDEVAPQPIEPAVATMPELVLNPEERSALAPPVETASPVIHQSHATSIVQTLVQQEAEPPPLDAPLPQIILTSYTEREVVASTETVERETVEQVVSERVEPPAGKASIVDQSTEPSLFSILEPEAQERAVHEVIERLDADRPVLVMEPPIEPDMPAAAPLPEPPAPQISIGEIVVELVTRPEATKPTAAAPPVRAARPAEVPAPRSGVRSKRGFGMGQV